MDSADPRYEGKLHDPPGGDTTMLMQQVREVMTVNHKMTDESSWISLTSDQMEFPLLRIRVLKVASVIAFGCGKQMKNKGRRPEGIVFTNADPRYG